MNLKRMAYHVFVGALVGGGAILPGISGGVLCLIFGIYEPLMETLSHPKSALKKYIGLFVPFLVGYALGFLGLAGVIGWIFAKNELLATWLFIGLIAGWMANPLKKHRLLLLAYGVLAGMAYSLIMDVWNVLWYGGGFDWALYAAAVTTALPHTILYAVSNFVFLYFLARPFGEKMERVKVKYGV